MGVYIELNFILFFLSTHITSQIYYILIFFVFFKRVSSRTNSSDSSDNNNNNDYNRNQPHLVVMLPLPPRINPNKKQVD